MALDLASAVTTHLDAVGPAFRQAGSPFGRSTYCFKYASLTLPHIMGEGGVGDDEPS